MNHKLPRGVSRCFSIAVCMLIIITSLPSTAYAQRQIVRGTVTDDTGLGFPGVSIMLKGTTKGTITDLDGMYRIDVSGTKNPTLEFSFVGFKTKTVKVGKQKEISFQMETDVAQLDEVVVVGYGTQKRISVTGAVNSVKAADLPTAGASVATALVGKLPGTVIVQNSGQAGATASQIRIRGASASPLILVDGVERGFESLDQDEIQSISVLKDASATAVYGIRGGDGVIIVTTKRGQMGKPKVSLKTEFGLIARGEVLDMLSSAEMAEMYNEGARNDAGVPLGVDVSGYTDPYSQYEIDMYKNNADPILYPSHNWYDDMTNDFGHRERYTLNLSGGTKDIRYFTSLGYMKERDAYKDFNVGYDDESYYERYNVRSNIDIDLTQSTVVSVDLGGQFATRHMPNSSFGELTNTMFRTLPNAQMLHGDKIVILNPENEDRTPYGELYNVGYKDNSTNKVQVALKVKQNLDMITEGLSFDMSLAYDHSFYNNYTASKRIPLYYAERVPVYDGEGNAYTPWVDPASGLIYNPLTGEQMDNDIKFMRNGDTESKLSGSRSTGTNKRNVNFKARLKYGRDFGRHHVGAVGVFSLNEQRYSVGSPSYVPFRYLEFAARASYNYAERYFLELNAGYNGSETFEEDNRFGFFPAVSGGWVLSNESFFPENDILTFVKFRGSYGQTGIDKSISRFAYYDAYKLSMSGGYPFGVTPSGQGISYQTKAGNPDVSWATNTQRNLALETKWFNDRLSLDFDVFKNEKEDIIMSPNAVPSVITAKLPPSNMKEIDYEGYEISGSWRDKIGDFQYHLRANYSYADAEVIFMDEIAPNHEWQALTGRHPQQVSGLDCVGFYSQEDIDALKASNWEGTPENPTSLWAGNNLQAGDLKYRDLDGNGIINAEDKKYWDNTSVPKTTFGFGGGFTYKNFSCNMFFQGVDDVTYSIDGFVRRPFQSGKTSGASYIQNRWTQERYDAGKKIDFPRMSAVTSDGDHNFQNSSFWFRDASYIRLKNVSVSYKFEPSLLKQVGVKKVKATLSATNLLTWTDLDIVDPESQRGNNAVLPPNKVFTLGLNFNF